MNEPRQEFIDSIKQYQHLFGLEIDDERTERLADFYEAIQENNGVLHLVGPCTPKEFATRHVLESLTMLEFLPRSARFVDIGAGGGLPSIPCLIVRNDLRAVLIESKLKKAAFLENAVKTLKIEDRARVAARQFEETDPSGASFVTCRALDKFTEKLPRIIRWSKDRKLLLFGGPNLKPLIEKERKDVTERLMPGSERRYLYIA